MIAVSFALPNESSGFIALLQKRVRKDGVLFGVLHGHEICVVHSGVGAKAARVRLESFLQGNTPRLLISSGFAGALVHDLTVGDLVATDDTRLRAALRDLPVHYGNQATCDRVLDSAEERAAVAAHTGAIAVDMEGEAIAAACTAHGVLMLSLRAVSDTSDASFPLPPAILFDVARQKTKYAQLLRHLVSHPRAIGQLARFARQIRQARDSLTRGLDTLLRHELRPE